MKVPTLKTAIGAGFVLLLLNTGYISAFATPSVFYMGNVLLHLVLGLVLAAAFALLLTREPELRRPLIAPSVLFAIALAFGLYVVWVGNLREHRWVLNAHIVSSVLGIIALLPFLFRLARIAGRPRTLSISVWNAALFAAVLPLVTTIYVKANPNPNDRIVNPSLTPASMNEEGGGPSSPFFPSSAKTNVGGVIPSNFFMDSETCGTCHKDIFEQWNSSAHHFASFNNQFYRKSIEYMQDVAGTRPSKWCAGCHDHAVFFNGRFETPIKQQIDTPEAQGRTRVHVVSCHHARAGIDGTGRFHRRVPGAARADEQQEQVHPRGGQLHDVSEPGAAPPDVHEAVHDTRLAGVLLVVPQGPPRRAGERLPLVPRLQ